MNRLFVTVILAVFVFVQCAFSANPELKEAADDDDEEIFEITQGNCTTAFAADMVYHAHVDKAGIPLLKRDSEAEWHGDQKIYCLKVINEDDDNSTRATVEIAEGGVGHRFITIEMHSKRSHGIDFDIEVYAK